MVRVSYRFLPSSFSRAKDAFQCTNAPERGRYALCVPKIPPRGTWRFRRGVLRATPEQNWPSIQNRVKCFLELGPDRVDAPVIFSASRIARNSKAHRWECIGAHRARVSASPAEQSPAVQSSAGPPASLDEPVPVFASAAREANRHARTRGQYAHVSITSQNSHEHAEREAVRVRAFVRR